MSSRTPGPMGLKFLGSSNGSKEFCGYEGRKPDKLFSQYNCRGFSVVVFLSTLTLFSEDVLCTVTGCLKMDAVCRIGGTKFASFLKLFVKSYGVLAVPLGFFP